MIEAEQVRLRLTNSKELLKELKRHKALKTDAQGDKLVLQFDGQMFVFRPGIVVTVGARIAKALLRASSVVVGDDLTGEIKPTLETAGRFQLGEEAPEESNRVTICPVCKKDCYNLVRLAKHIQVAHRTDRPDLYTEEKTKTDWDTPIEDDDQPNNGTAPVSGAEGDGEHAE